MSTSPISFPSASYPIPPTSTSSSPDHISSKAQPASDSSLTLPTQTPPIAVNSCQNPISAAEYVATVLQGDQGSSQALEDHLDTCSNTIGEDLSEEITTTSKNRAPQALLEQGVIVETSSSIPDPTSLGSGLTSARPLGTLFGIFKNANGAPALESRPPSSRGTPSTQYRTSQHASVDPLGTSTASTNTSNNFNVYEEVELAGALEEQTQRENTLSDLAIHQLETQDEDDKINKNQKNINAKINQEQQSSSSAKNHGAVIALDVVTLGFYALAPQPQNSTSTPATITTSLSGPNGKELRSTTVIITSTENGSLSYTRTTEGVRGQTTNINGEITTDQGITETTQGNETVNITGYQRDYSGTRTTADGRTIDVEGSADVSITQATYQGEGPKDLGILDGSSLNRSDSKRVRDFSGSKDNQFQKTIASEKRNSKASLQDSELQAVEAIENAMKAFSELTERDRQTMTTIMHTLTLAAMVPSSIVESSLLIFSPTLPSQPSLHIDTINTPEAIEHELLAHIYQSLSFAFKKNLPITINEREILIQSLFDYPEKAERFLATLLSEKEHSPSHREIVDIFQVKSAIKKWRQAEELFNSESVLDTKENEDHFLEESSFLRAS